MRLLATSNNFSPGLNQEISVAFVVFFSDGAVDGTCMYSSTILETTPVFTTLCCNIFLTFVRTPLCSCSVLKAII